jgi:hypothetical protein
MRPASTLAALGLLTGVTSRSNELGTVIAGINPLGIVNGLLEVPTVPTALEPFTCK